MKIISTNLAKPTTIFWNGSEVTTGIYKKPVNFPILLGNEGVHDDEISDRNVHGGEFKACYLFSADQYRYWKNLYPNLGWQWGMFGENLTVSGLNEKEIHIGDIYKIGSIRVQITQPREPCFKFGVKFGTQNILSKFINHGFPGTYVRILKEGYVKTGDSIELVEKARNSLSTWQFFDLLFNKEKNTEHIKLILDNNAIPKRKRDKLKRFLK
ncbi:MOSC domain-containing protein [uncultured Algibacter sp.]|uniref:MOSC domain-containing protein n=1 Tax=uncultured Algibacter sp. TaxID=298659 RepID=UPI002613931A|nr:MOSC domain-containing protein [uncultured Algibacter sp.]